MIDRETIIQVHSSLASLLVSAQAGKVDGRYGICAALEEDLETLSIDPDPVFEQLVCPWIGNWPSCSWHADFPVPSPDPTRSPHAYFVKASREGTMWQGAYGASRIELLQHLVRKAYLAAYLN